MAIVRINNLFGHYTNEIDLSKKCTILIGENGLGKSTIIRIINNLINGNYLDLCRNYFDSIQIINNNDVMTLRMSDILPKPECMIECIKLVCENKMAFDDEDIDDEYIKENYVQLMFGIHRIIERYGNKMYYKFLSNIFFDKPLDAKAKNIIPRVMQSTEYSEMYLHKVLKSAIYYYFEHYTVGSINSEAEFVKSNIANILNNYNCFYFDLVDKYSINEELIDNEERVFCREISWLKKYSEKIYPDIDRQDELKEYISKPIYFSSRIGIEYYTDNGKVMEGLAEAAKYFYKDPRITIKNVFSENEFMRKINEKHIAYINQMILQEYYNEDFIKEVNIDAIKYYEEIIGIETEYDRITPTNDIEKIYEDYIKYFKPIVIKNSLFDFPSFNLPFSTPDAANLIFMHQAIYDKFIEFYNNEFERFKANRSEKIIKFETLLSKYLFNKEVCIYPCGLRIYAKNTKTQKHKSGFKLIDNLRDEISLNSLSSGEKKIVIILFLSIFFEEKLLLIDEPELSLSIVWQSSLLPDLLNETNIKQIIIATHSPFIAEDESLHQYLLPLSNEGGEDEYEQ